MTDLPAPVYPPLTTVMKVDFVCNPDGRTWLLHDQPLPAILKWADYDTRAATLTLNYQNGKVQELGLPVPPAMKGPLRLATELSVFFMKDGKMADFAAVPLHCYGD